MQFAEEYRIGGAKVKKGLRTVADMRLEGRPAFDLWEALVGCMLDTSILSAFEHYRRVPLVTEIFTRLLSELPSTVVYHAYSHSQDVFEEALRFAVIAGLQSRDIELIAIAAAFHDAGFITSSGPNESIAAELAVAGMRRGGYSDKECALVRQMILDTALISSPQGLVQSPSTPLSGYLLDADLSNLGREDFFQKGELQRQETNSDEVAFWKATLSLIKAHAWITPVARAMRDTKQRRNVALLEEKLAASA
jgi:predicted metal-dependent HD superfamily phosphohydrolase